MQPTVSAHAGPDNTSLAEPVECRSIITRFGELVIDESKVITFVDGLYGFEDHHQYFLTSVPDWPDIFKLLQAVDDPQLSLIVLPLEATGGPIDADDFAQAYQALAFNQAATTVLGIVTMRADAENQMFTVNLKAPVLIDTDRRQGRQHVFASDKYRLRHPIPVAEHQEV